MSICNDLMSMQYLNSVLIWQSLDVAAKRSHGRSYEQALNQRLIAMHRRWTIRMATVLLSDSITLFRQISNRLRKEMTPGFDETRSRHSDIQKLVKEHGDNIRNIRNLTGAHTDDKGAFSSAAKYLTKHLKRKSEKAEWSTKPFAYRYYIADDIMSAVSTQSAWNLDGPPVMNDPRIDEILDGIFECAKELFGFFHIYVGESIVAYQLAD